MRLLISMAILAVTTTAGGDELVLKNAKLDVPARGADYATARLAGWGHLRGRFVFDGKAPRPKPLRRDVEYFSKFKIEDASLVVGKDNGLANVLVHLADEPKRVHHGYAAMARREVTLQAVKGRFEPRMLVMLKSQTLVLKNPQPVATNMNFQSSRQAFNVLVPPVREHRMTLKRPESAPVRMTSNVHPWFLAHCIVLEHPYAAVSRPDGTFEIRNLPAGELEYRLWHERSPKGLTIKPGGEPGRIKVTIKSGETTDLGTIKIPPEVLVVK